MFSNSSTFDLQSKVPPPFRQYARNESWAPDQRWAKLKFRSGPNQSTEIKQGRPAGVTLWNGHYYNNYNSSNIPFDIPSGGTEIIIATAGGGGGGASWAYVYGSGGDIWGNATYRLTGSNGKLVTMVGVEGAYSLHTATIPVNDDVDAERFTGYATALGGLGNSVPGGIGNIYTPIDVMEVSEDGSQATLLYPIYPDASEHTAAFLFQNPKAHRKFRGSAVFVSRTNYPISSGKTRTFTITALLQDSMLSGPSHPRRVR